MTPKATTKAKQRINDSAMRTPIADTTPMGRRRTSSTMNSLQKKTLVSKKRPTQAASPVSETASEKAVKDAMMKTSQKIYNPKEFKLPGQ